MKHPRLLLAGIVLLSFGLFLLVTKDVWVEWYVRRHLKEHYPWIYPVRMAFTSGYSSIEMTGVIVDKEWATGVLTKVTYDRKTGHVDVLGGTLKIDLDRKTAGVPTGTKLNLTVCDVDAMIVKGPYSADVHNLEWDGEVVHFEHATVWYAGHEATLAFGHYVPKQTLTVGTARLELVLPHMIPGLPELTSVVLVSDDLILHEDTLAAEAGQLHVWAGMRGHVKLEDVQVTRTEDRFTVKSKVLAVQHPWLAGQEYWTVLDAEGYYDRSMPEFALVTPVQLNWMPSILWAHTQGSCQQWASLFGLEQPFKGDLTVGVAYGQPPTLKMGVAQYPATCAPVSCEGFQKLRKPFEYTAYHADGTTFTRHSGPGTVDWVPLSAMGSFPEALVTREDPGFRSHRGWSLAAYQNSLVENLKEGKFVRGGSTLTMQLMKNLYLSRDKTLVRKGQELLLAMAAEKCLSKEEIIELYANVVEYGPDVYGVGAGAQRWFRKGPAGLTEVESFWLAGVLPAPKKAVRPDEQVLKSTEKLMGRMRGTPSYGGADEVDTKGWEMAQ